VASVQDYQLRGSGFKSWPGQTFGLRFLLHQRPLLKSAMMSALIVYTAEDKKMKLLILHTHICSRASSNKEVALLLRCAALS